MIRFNATIEKYDANGEKTGWTYIKIPMAIAQQLKPDNKKAFRVKGYLDDFAIEGVSLIPIGGGDFILAVNATMRKGIRKQKGATVDVKLAVDEKEIKPPADFMECLADEPAALAFYSSLPKSHQHYFTRWINEAKTEGTRVKRISHSVTALATGADFGQTLRALKKNASV